jgi:hypothetical protein
MLPIHNTLDVMHVEWNVSDSILKYLSSERDTVEVHKDIEETHVKWYLWLHQDPRGENYVKPQAPYVFTSNERTKFLDFVYEICATTSYVVGFRKHIGLNKLFNMKNHDHHIMMQHILPNGVWNLLHIGPRIAIICLGKCFQKICTKVLNPNDIRGLWTYVVETLCMLEM